MHSIVWRGQVRRAPQIFPPLETQVYVLFRSIEGPQSMVFFFFVSVGKVWVDGMKKVVGGCVCPCKGF